MGLAGQIPCALFLVLLSTFVARCLASPKGSLTLDGFRSLIADVKMDIIVIDRPSVEFVFNRLANGDGVITTNELLAGLRKGDDRELLRVLVDAWYYDRFYCDDLQCPVIQYAIDNFPATLFQQAVQSTVCMIACYQIPGGYDWSKSTRDNYQLDPSTLQKGEQPFYGENQGIRRTLDHMYHGFYTVARQFWQDAAISRMVDSTARGQNEPWMVYTAGGMGTGKGYVLETMSKMGIWAEERMVMVNPDNLKKMMPEFNLYTQHGQHNGDHTHLESGFMQEIIVQVALNRRSHLVEDGSLRNVDWYTGKGARTSDDPGSADWIGIIPGLRKRHPHYRIAILHTTVQLHTEAEVHAELERRLLLRTEKTGRETPLQKAIVSVGEAAATVQRVIELGLADLVVEFNNADAPEITRAVVDGHDQPLGSRSEAWRFIAERFSPKALRIDMSELPISKKKDVPRLGGGRLRRITNELDQAWPHMLASVASV